MTTEQINTQEIIEPKTSEVLADLEHQIKDLQAKLKLARGTVNNLRPMRPDIKSQIERLLLKKPRSQEEIAAELGESVGRVNEIVKEIRPRLKNVGSEDRPAWWLVPGASVSTADLNAAVLALMSYRPVSFKELVDYTGARSDRVAGAVGIAVKTRSVVNAGSQVTARWFLVPPDSLAKLTK